MCLYSNESSIRVYSLIFLMVAMMILSNQFMTFWTTHSITPWYNIHAASPSVCPMSAWN